MNEATSEDISPSINTIPLETLGEILVLALESLFWDAFEYDEENDTSTAASHVARIQQTLALVGRRFRQAALSDPRCWRTTVVCPDATGRLPTHVLECTALRRSGALSLRVLCHVPPEEGFSHRVFTVLPKYLDTRRVASLLLYLPRTYILTDTNKRWSRMMQVFQDNGALRQLGLRTYEVAAASGPFYAQDWALQLLSIGTLHYISTNLAVLSYSPEFPSDPMKDIFPERLTHLSVGPIKVPRLMDLLRCTPQLEHLRIQNVVQAGPMVFQSGHRESFAHQSLETLCIDRASDRHILEHLTLPALKALEFTPPPGAWPQSITGDVAFFDSAHSCSLERLAVWSDYPNVSIVNIIMSQTSLRELTFDFITDHYALMDQTTPMAHTTPNLPDDVIARLHAPQLPLLQSLSLVVIDKQLPVLRKMLVARMEAQNAGMVASLRFLGITVWNAGRTDLPSWERNRVEEEEIYRKSRKDGWKHRALLDDILAEFEGEGTEVYLAYQGYSTLAKHSMDQRAEQMLGAPLEDY